MILKRHFQVLGQPSNLSSIIVRTTKKQDACACGRGGFSRKIHDQANLVSFQHDDVRVGLPLTLSEVADSSLGCETSSMQLSIKVAG